MGVLPVPVGNYQPSSFIPTEQKKSFGQQPCLHTTAMERLSSGYGIYLFAVLVHTVIYLFIWPFRTLDFVREPRPPEER